jgi:CheY-like chemotaxis protein
MARILVVDDEESIRKVLRQVLEYEGHEVRVAAGGGEALTVYEEWLAWMVSRCWTGSVPSIRTRTSS